MKDPNTQNLEPDAKAQEENATPLPQWHDDEIEHPTHIGWYFLTLLIAILLMTALLCFKPL